MIVDYENALLGMSVSGPYFDEIATEEVFLYATTRVTKRRKTPVEFRRKQFQGEKYGEKLVRTNYQKRACVFILHSSGEI